MKTVFFVVNKNWEVEPVLNALTQKEFRPKPLPYPSQLSSPRRDNSQSAAPRAIYYLPTGDVATATLKAVVWCVQDLMTQDYSSSEEKHRVLPDLYRADAAPALVVAVGTAASTTTDRSIAGSVVLGGQFFLHDSGAADSHTTSHLALPNDLGKVLDGGAAQELVALLAAAFQQGATAARLLPVVNLPSADPDLPAPAPPQVLATRDGISLGTLNVTNYGTYPAADQATLTAFNAVPSPGAPGVSVETTHGLIRLSAPAGVPVLFVSGIANRVLHYDTEATALHRYTAAFNMGVVVGDMLVELANKVGQW